MKISHLQPEPLQLLVKSDHQSKNSITPKDFGKMFNQAVEKINQRQIKADQSINDYLLGKEIDLHTVMIAVGEAQMSLELAVQIRNKMVEAYQEVSRMQI